MSEIPEGGWPSIPVVRPGRADPVLEGGVVDVHDDAAVDEVLDFYRAVLVPQLACGPASSDHWPHRGWLQVADPPRTLVVVRRAGELAGAWVVKDGAILYPVAHHEHVAATFRALWDESTRHVDYLYGESSNPLVMKFAQAAMRRAPLPTSPRLSEDGLRVEWRRA